MLCFSLHMHVLFIQRSMLVLVSLQPLARQPFVPLLGSASLVYLLQGGWLMCACPCPARGREPSYGLFLISFHLYHFLPSSSPTRPPSQPICSYMLPLLLSRLNVGGCRSAKVPYQQGHTLTSTMDDAYVGGSASCSSRSWPWR